MPESTLERDSTASVEDIQHTHVLVVDDDPRELQRVSSLIQSWHFDVRTASNGAEALREIESERVDVLVTDLMMPIMGGEQLLKQLNERGDAPPSIVLTAFGTIEQAISIIHDLGAFWFAEKPVQPDILKALVERAATHSRLALENRQLRSQLSHQGVLDELLGNSNAMKRLFATDCPHTRIGPGHWRERVRKRTRRPRHPSPEPSSQTALRRYQLRRAA